LRIGEHAFDSLVAGKFADANEWHRHIRRALPIGSMAFAKFMELRERKRL
jgi:hypothetical protein